MKNLMKLGDIDVARIGLGTNRVTKSPGNVAFVKGAVAAGIQMIDTAHSYTGGVRGRYRADRGARRVVPVAAVQNQYNLSERKYEAARSLRSARATRPR